MNERGAKILRRYVAAKFPPRQQLKMYRALRSDLKSMTHRQRGDAYGKMIQSCLAA